MNARHATAKAMPAVARMEKMIVRGRSTDASSSKGTPSYGTRPPAWKVHRGGGKIRERKKVEKRKHKATQTP